MSKSFKPVCVDCGQFVSFVNSTVAHGGKGRVHAKDYGCKHPKAEEQAQAEVRRVAQETERAFAQRRQELANQVSIPSWKAQQGRIAPLASAFIRAGLAK